MNTPDPLTELRDYVAGQVVASEKAIAYINQLHEEREAWTALRNASMHASDAMGVAVRLFDMGPHHLLNQRKISLNKALDAVDEILDKTRRATP